MTGLSACATTTPPSAPENQNQPWSMRAQTLSALTAWDIRAAIAFRTDSDAESANLDWQQNNQDYTMLVSGPLGTTAFKLTGSEQGITLDTAQGKHFSAPTPEALLLQQTGWQLPVSSLYYWIRGLPAPNLPAQKQFDAFHHLTQLQQANWTIHYLAYTSVNHLDLPSKITLSNPQHLQIKIVIHAWQSNL